MPFNQYEKLSIDCGGGGNHPPRYDRSASPYPSIPFPEESSYASISPYPSIPPPATMEYVTIQGNVIRSVIPPGKGVHVDYSKVNQSYAPRPFNQGPMSPSSAGQRSPGGGAPNWAQPRPAQQAQNPYATLPRQEGQTQSEMQLQEEQQMQEMQSRRQSEAQSRRQSEAQSRRQSEQKFESQSQTIQQQKSAGAKSFVWPPQEVIHKDVIPTATPIYIPPPGTQHVAVKEISEEEVRRQEEEVERHQELRRQHQEQHLQTQRNQKTTIQQLQQQQKEQHQQSVVQMQQYQSQMQQQQQRQSVQMQQYQSSQTQQQQQKKIQVQQQTRCASEQTSSYSESYGTTSTTTTTSEEFSKMSQLAQSQAYQIQQQSSDQQTSGSEYDYHLEIDQSASTLKQQQEHSFSLSSQQQRSQTSHRSTQECADSLNDTLNMSKLIDMVREVTPSPTPMNKPRKVEFVEPEQQKSKQEPEPQKAIEQIQDSGLSTIHEEKAEVPKEWINPMVKVLTIAPEKPFELHSGLDEYMEAVKTEQTTTQESIQQSTLTEVSTRQEESLDINSKSEGAPYYCSTVECKTTSKIPYDVNICQCLPNECKCQKESAPETCTKPCEQTQKVEPNTTCPKQEQEEKPWMKKVDPVILKEQPPKGSVISKVLASAPEHKFEFAPKAGEYIPLPDYSDPYIPPPIDMTPYTKEDDRPKSPMGDALITAPSEPYKRFDHDVCSQLLDLPTAKEKLSMMDALITAPETPYNPLSTENVLKLHLDEKPKEEYIHLSLEEQNKKTEQILFEKRQESMDKKITAFVSLEESKSSESKSSKQETKEKKNPSISCATPYNSIEIQSFPDQCPAGFQPPPGAIQVLPHHPPPSFSAIKQQSHHSSEPSKVVFPPTPEQLSKELQEESFKQRHQSSTSASAIAASSAASATSTFNASSMQSNAIQSSASFASNQSASSINSRTTIPNIDTKSAPTTDIGSGGNSASGKFGQSATSTPKRGRGVLNKAVGPGSRIPQCGACQNQIRGPFITALGRIWCPEHFVCVNGSCRRPLQDIGFVEEKGDLYCEFCFEKFLAPTCSKCNGKIKGDCLNAVGKHFHPECFTCAYCGKIFGNTPFFLEDGEPYCEADWNELFTTKCFACGFPIEAGDRWVEALNHNYHSQCFNCTMCKKNLEGQSFYNKGGRPFCKNHAR